MPIPRGRGGKAAKKALGLLAGVTFVRQGTLKVEQENQSCPQPRLLLAPATPFITQVGFHTLTPLHSEIGLLKDLGCCEFPRHCFNWWDGNKNTLKFHLAVKSDLEVAPYRSWSQGPPRGAQGGREAAPPGTGKGHQFLKTRLRGDPPPTQKNIGSETIWPSSQTHRPHRAPNFQERQPSRHQASLAP